MLDLHRLRALHEFALHGTITGAAVSLGYTPAAVSQQLSTLERETGAALLERTARSARLTPAGQALAGRARVILDAVEEAESETLAAGGRVAGEIVVSAVPTIAVLLAPVLTDFMASHPQVHVALRQSSPARALEQLRSRDLDLVVVDEWLPVSEPDIARTRLVRDPLLLALPPEHQGATATGAVSTSELAALVDEHTWLCAPRDEPSRAVTDELLRRSGATPAAVWEIEGLATIAHLVAGGVGVSLLPAIALDGLPDDRAVATRPLRPARNRTLVVKTRTASRKHPVVAACRKAIRDAPW